MSQSGSGKPDPDLEGVELLFHEKGGSASFGTKMALSLNGVDPSLMNSITGFTCRAKCSHILHDKWPNLERHLRSSIMLLELPFMFDT
jgi:hypothetical protein